MHPRRRLRSWVAAHKPQRDGIVANNCMRARRAVLVAPEISRFEWANGNGETDDEAVIIWTLRLPVWIKHRSNSDGG